MPIIEVNHVTKEYRPTKKPSRPGALAVQKLTKLPVGTHKVIKQWNA